jgi:serine/threonine protein kinase
VPPADVPLAAGTFLGKYQVLRLLAVGGMAEIYLARATGIAGFEKALVLKRILPHLADDPEFVAMFLDEARLTATLGHPNVVQVYDVDRVGQDTFFTMELVNGRDLTSVLAACAQKKRGLSLSHALYIVREVASGLHYAHDKKGKDGQPLGTVHRDVSPGNVMVSFEGLVKIVDFGIAKAALRSSKTKSGMVKGTVLYMSPEQAQGHELDRRSDVFSLGILLYELTTGTRPFRGPSDYAVLHKLISEDAPPPTAKRPNYPPALERIVLRALARDREARYPTAGALRDELEQFMKESALVATASSLGAFMRELFDQREDTADLFALPPLPSTPQVAEPRPGSSVSIPLERRGRWDWLLVLLVAAGLGLTWFVTRSASETSPTASATSSARTAPAPPHAPVHESGTTLPPPPASPGPPPPSAPPRSAPFSAKPKPHVSSSPAPSAPPSKEEKKWNLDSPLPP